MRYGLIILDFDGTLADTRKTIVRTLQMTMQEKGLPVRADAECAATIGLPLEEGFRTLFPGLAEAEVAGCAGMYREIFQKNKDELTPEMFPGVRETLEALSAAGHILTIASSRHKASLEEFLGGFGIGPLIRLVLGAGEVAKAKPDPEPVLKTLSMLGCRGEDTLVVGDMPFDVLMGKRAGACACGVTYGNSSREELLASGADHVIDTFPELLEIA